MLSYAAFLFVWMVFSILNFPVTISAASSLSALIGATANLSATLLIASRFAILLFIGWLVLFRASWWGVAGIALTLAEYAFSARTHVEYAIHDIYRPSDVWLASFAFLLIAAGAIMHKQARKWLQTKGKSSRDDATIFE